MELPEGWIEHLESPDVLVNFSGNKPPLKPVVELAALGYMWIEPEPTGGSTYAWKPGRSISVEHIPISDYIAKRRSENGTA